MARSSIEEISESGAFARSSSTFRRAISRDPRSPFLLESGRYHLYIADGCPWACRCLSISKIKGLGRAISFSVLWDKKLKTIVNNEISDIIRMFNAESNDIAENAVLDLYPPALQFQIDDVNERIYTGTNNGVYKCGFAMKQGPYEEAVKNLYDTLDKYEEILGKQRYICGSSLTESDIQVRFDEVYAVHFKCNQKLIREYQNLFNYTKDIFQIPGMSSTVSMEHIKRHYYGSRPSMDPLGIIPVGPNIDYPSPHNRERFSI